MDTMKFSRNLYPLAAKFSILYCSLFFEFFSHIDKISIQLDNQAIDKNVLSGLTKWKRRMELPKKTMKIGKCQFSKQKTLHLK